MPFLDDVYEDDPFDLDEEWEEATGTTQPGGGEQFSANATEASIVVELTGNDRSRAFERRVLGFSCVKRTLIVPEDPTSGYVYSLHRENPVRFPWLPNTVYAAGVSFSSLLPDGSTQTPLQVESPFSLNCPPAYAAYKKCYATVRFARRRERFLGDDEPVISDPVLGSERHRNTFWDVAASVEMLSAEGSRGQMRWGETTPGGGMIGPSTDPATNQITQAFGTLVSKSTYLLSWTGVPHEWVSSADYPFAKFDNLDACVGRVNDRQFGPFLPGTALMQPYRSTAFQWPVLTKDGESVFQAWDFQIPFQVFDPPKGNPQSTYRGYRLLPFPANGLWYLATRTDTGKYLLPETDLNAIFRRPTRP